MGLSVVLESSIMQKGLPATAGSKMLENFIAPVDATVVTRLEAAGVKISGRVDTSEFGAAGLFEDAAGGTATQGDGSLVFFAKTAQENRPLVLLCNDYTGGVSRAAVDAGLYYIQPSYGTVSRYGLIPSVGSMDQIGIVCENPEDGFEILEIISGYDAKDGVMLPNSSKTYEPQEVSSSFEIDIADMKSDYSGVYKQVMQILCSAELSNNISRYDGIKFGYRAKEYKDLNELYTKSRTEAFGEDVKLAAVTGAMVLYGDNYERYYNKAMCIRRLIKESLEFGEYDVIVSKCPILSRLCGLPSLSVPGGRVYTADALREDVLKAVSKSVINGNTSLTDDKELGGKIKAIRNQKSGE
ncbi:MAG: amidase family protein [Oscillospiraceae bacterium]|nr:amidase family protein [Oscillospiraceae bacterium]